jgi:hypothetical protein
MSLLNLTRLLKSAISAFYIKQLATTNLQKIPSHHISASDFPSYFINTLAEVCNFSLFNIAVCNCCFYLKIAPCSA